MYDLHPADSPKIAYGHLRRRGALLALWWALVGFPTPAAGQDATLRADSARSAFAEGRLPEADRLLAALTSDFPTDPGLQWLHAQVLRAVGALDDARGAYQRATELAPDDPWLRLEFGRFLVEKGEFSEGKEVLDPVRGLGTLPEAVREAETLMGLASYWDGDLYAAELHLRRAVELDPGKSEASSALREVLDQRANSVAAGTAFSDDDQPLRRLSQSAQIGMALGGRVRGHVTASIERRSMGDSGVPVGGVGSGGSGDRTELTLGAMTGVALSLPGGRVRLNLEAGAIRRGVDQSTAPLGAALASLKVAAETYLRAGVGRTAYLWTAASLDTALAVSSLELRLDRAGSPGWAGEAGLRLERYPDGNMVRTVSAWILAPAYLTTAAGIRVGYAGALGDSRFNTFRVADSANAIGPPGEALPGVYAPYFTPEQVRIHSLILEGRAGVSSQTSLSVTAVYAPWAREFAPGIFRDALGAMLPPILSERAFHPWSVRAQLTSAASAPARLTLSAEHARTAFYGVTRIEAGLEYRFTASHSGRR